MKSIQLKSILALFLTGILVWTGCKKKDEKPTAVGPSITSLTATSTPSGTTSGDTLKVNLGASITFNVKVAKGNTSEDKVLKQFKVTKELVGVGALPNLKDTTYTEAAKKENVEYTLNDAVSATTSGTYKYVFTISDYNGKTASKTYFVKSGTPCGISVSVTSVASDSLTVTAAGSGLTSGGYEYSFDGGTTWSSTATYTYTSTGSKTIQVRQAGTPSCASSTTFNVTGKKLRENTGINMGAESSSKPSCYDADGNHTYSISTIAAADRVKVDFLCHTSGVNTYLWAPATSSAIFTGYLSSWSSSERMNTKFYGTITQAQYDNAVTNADINGFTTGSSTDKSPNLAANSGFAFETVNASGNVVARGIVWVTAFTAGASGEVTFKVKMFTL
jgi:hypothetical protein